MRLYRSLLILAGVWIWADAACAQPYTDPTIGFSIVKPSDWFFIDEGEIERSQQMQKLDNEALEALIKKSADKPLVALSKFREPYDDANPSVVINVHTCGAVQGRRPGADRQGDDRGHDQDIEGRAAGGMLGRHQFVGPSGGVLPVHLYVCDIDSVISPAEPGSGSSGDRSICSSSRAPPGRTSGTERSAEVNAVIRNIKIDLRS